MWLVERAEDYRRRKHPTEIPHSFAKQDLLRHDGCSIIFVNDDHELLLYQRDNDPSIQEPGNWDLFGGSIESDEEPDQAIVREVAEEIGISGQPTSICLAQHHFFRKYSFDDRDDYVYWCRLNEPANKLWTTEGRDPTWFSPEQIEQKEDIAFGFKRVLVDFSKWLRDGKRW